MSRARLWAPRAILVGTLVVGTIDAIDAVVFFGLRGAAPLRIFQGIAAGAVGREAARAGGWATGALGVVFHYLVAAGIVSTYALAARAMPPLGRHPIACGIAYGIAAYFFMNLVVIPLSLIGRSLSRPVRSSTASSSMRLASASRRRSSPGGRVARSLTGRAGLTGLAGRAKK